MMSETDRNLSYFAKQQCSVQWQAFLTAFSAELGQQIPANELRVLMSRLGHFMAQNLPIPSGNTVAELEASINSIWFDMNWGWIELVEKKDELHIEHHAAPLQAAFGADALAWSPAILEGIYAQWLSALSGSSALKLTQVGTAVPDSMILVFRYGKSL
jgi:hypothetical protein